MRALPLLALLLAAAAAAQPLAFGSADDPFEWGGTVRLEQGVRVGAYLGPAYLPDTWRGAARLDLDAAVGRLSVGLGRTVHSGDGGLYGPEDDELYDLARALRYVRLNATPGSRVYARLGPLERVSLGSGALVSRYRTTTAYDERAIGAEAAAQIGGVRVAGFVDDVLRADGVAGAEIGLRTGLPVGPVEALGLTVAGVHDLGRPGLSGDSSLTGVEVTVRGTYRGFGPVAVQPFATHARYLGRGSLLGGGVEVGAPNVGDAARARLRVGVFASSRGMVPGHVGPFYAVSNGDERIVDDGTFFDPTEPNALAGTPLDSLAQGVDVVIDGRIVAFGRAEVSTYVRRHFGEQKASGFGLRLAGRIPGDGRLAFELERQDYRGFLDLLQDLGQLNALVLDVRLPVGSRGAVFVRSRYGYRRLTAADGPDYADGPGRFLVERRFEPLVGIRFGG